MPVRCATYRWLFQSELGAETSDRNSQAWKACFHFACVELEGSVVARRQAMPTASNQEWERQTARLEAG